VKHTIRPVVQRILDQIDAPALVRNSRLDHVGANPYDRKLSDLVGELSTRSDEFRVRWAAHNVRFQSTGTKHIHHPVVGDWS
jgi:hypothetical protein